MTSKGIDVRTTLTIDDDVMAKLQQRARDTGQPFKVVVNEALRLGLISQDALNESMKEPAFVIKTRELGAKPGISFDNVAELLEQVEGPSHR